MAEVTCQKCRKVCASLQGWKRHMSSSHGGYDTQDLIEAVGENSAESADNVRERMDRFASTLPGGETQPKTERDGTTPVGSGTPPAPGMPGERRVRATPKKLKKILGGIPARMLEESKIELDSEDRDALDEAGEFLADVFGVEFSVPESKVVVESRFWAFVWVAGITGLIYIKHRFPFVAKYVLKMFKPKDETSAETVEETEARAATGD